jgi:hypothetical protein
MRFTRLNICAALLCCTLAACSNNDEKSWEPEVAVSLALFELDISQHLAVGSTTISFFKELPAGLKKSSLKRAIASLDSINSSAKNDLSPQVRYDMDNFRMDRNPVPADDLLQTLITNFQERRQFFAINRFAYEIMSEAGEQDEQLELRAVNIFEKYRITFTEQLLIEDMDQIVSTERVNQIRWAKALTSIHSRLPVAAKILLNMYSASGEVLDSLLRNNDQSGAVMPFPDETGNWIRIVHEYEPKDVQRIIPSIGKLVIEVMSDSLGLTLDHVKNLHDMKIRASIGLTLKMATSDLVN